MHKNSADIAQSAHQETLRNVVIREAIEIENLIYRKIKNGKDKRFTKQRHSFSNKINYYYLANNDEKIFTKLNDLKKLRNDFAHGNNLQQTNLRLLDFLEDVEDIKNEIIAKDNTLGT